LQGTPLGQSATDGPSLPLGGVYLAIGSVPWSNSDSAQLISRIVANIATVDATVAADERVGTNTSFAAASLAALVRLAVGDYV
jgi:hypothetical protein